MYNFDTFMTLDLPNEGPSFYFHYAQNLFYVIQ